MGDGQTESFLKDMDMTVLASAWAMAIRRTKKYRRKMDLIENPTWADSNYPGFILQVKSISVTRKYPEHSLT